MHWLSWNAVALRLICALAAGAAIGFDRGEHGRPAGLRTTMLVCAAACVAMLQASLLMPTAGKSGDSFVVLDLARFPLGILSGMGFIGAGTIVRRGNLAQGITTAATLWFVTVIGLSFGGGQIGLGWGGTAGGLAVLVGLRPLDRRIRRKHRGTLAIVTGEQGPDEAHIRAGLGTGRYSIESAAVVHRMKEARHELRFQLSWQAAPGDTGVPTFVRALAQHPGVEKVTWKSQAT